MADADVPITAGTGTKIDTRTVGAGADEHRQVIVVGDPATAANVASVDANGLYVQLRAVAAGVAIPIVGQSSTPTAGSWTSATAVNTAVTVSNAGPYGAANIAINVPTTITAGTVRFEVSHDGTTYYPAGSVRIDNSLPENDVSLAFAPGINGNRQWLVSLDAFTNVRARLTAAIAGTGTVTVAVTVGQQGVEPFVATRARKIPTYGAQYRATARSYRLTNTFTANTRKQYATIHHAATATKTVRLRRVQFAMIAVGATGDITVDLVRITTAPATGNPAITSSRASTGDATAEATCLALPTTAGTEEAQPFGSLYFNAGASGSPSTTIPAPESRWIDMFDPGLGDDEARLPEIRAGVLEGWAVTVDYTAAAAISALVRIEFSEEAP